MAETFVVVGASDKQDRYSYKALTLLKQNGFDVIPIHPKLQSIQNIPVVESLAAIKTPIDSITMYVGPDISKNLVMDIIRLKPKRIIFNPGSENPSIYPALKDARIKILEACTIVMLNTGQLQNS